MSNRRFAFIIGVLVFTTWFSLSPSSSSLQLRHDGLTTTTQVSASTSFTASRNESITSQDDLQSLLDFAIIGPPKMATTFLLYRLNEQPKLISSRHELKALQDGNLELFIKNMSALPTCEGCKRFYKKPGDSYSPRALDIYRKHFPKAKMIIGLRHPLLWFESFYNYRVRRNIILPPADSPEFLGECRHIHNVCVEGSLFHCQLALLGKTNNTGQENFFNQQCKEDLLLHQQYTPNPVFLYEIHQVASTGDIKTFTKDLSEFLELDEALPEWKETPHHHADQFVTLNQPAPSHPQKALNICDNKYRALRDVLMENARNASLWIRNYFIQSEEVTISSQEQFVSFVEGWMVDPCIERNNNLS
jgi:hypothetical protein